MRGRLEAMIRLTETTACRTRSLLACFGEALADPCGHCDTCRHPVSLFDGTVEAQKVLSAVYRTGQIFGAQHVIAVLRGQETEMVLRHRHQALPTFGIGADRPREFWRSVIRQLIAAGLLHTESGEFSSLALVPDRARPVLRGEERVQLREDVAAPPPRRRAERAPATPLPDAPQGLFDTLRAWRAAEAKTQSVPPYVIFHDSVLREIAAVRPASLSELGQIKGVGASKLERYGIRVLATLGRAAA